MRLLEAKLHKELNAAYAAFNPHLDGEPFDDRVIGFSRYIKDRYGLEVRLHPKINDAGKMGYELNQVYVTDEAKFTFFLLEWA